MQIQSKISSIATAVIVTAAVAVPSASAMPIDGPGTQGATSGGSDTADLRTEGSRGPATSPAAPPGLPTWPSHPEPIVPATAEPAAATDGDGGGLDWPAIVIIAVGAAALTGGLVLKLHQRAPRSRAAH